MSREYPTREIVIKGVRYKAEKRKSGWHLIEFWDTTRTAATDGKEHGWLFLLPKEQVKVDIEE